MISEVCLISYKLELRLQGESVDGQEAIEGSSIDQLYDEIWEVYREYAQQCSLFFIIKLDSNHANHMRPGATKGTLRRENENSFFDVLCLITFHWSF